MTELRYVPGPMNRARVLLGAGLATVAAVMLVAPTARADDWMPHPVGATWQYQWSDTAYNPGGTTENVVVQQQTTRSFTLAWANPGNQPPAAGSGGIACPSGADIGEMSFQDSNAGLLNTNWNSCPPPSDEPILCPTTACANSLSSTLYNVIWGSRAPVLSEPLLRGTTWTATGGAANDVSSSSAYLGLQVVKVPAYPNGILAAVVRTNIVQAGALGDPYGSGVRTVWWVRGVGPVRIAFQHAGASSAPTTNAYLLATNLKPSSNLPDQNYFPLPLGMTGTYRWTNSRYLRHPEIERMTVAAVANRSARITVKSVSGPLRVVAQYGFTTRLDGITNIFGASSAASLVTFPSLTHRRHFFTPFDLLTFGFNPLIPAYPNPGDRWTSGNATDMRNFGVSGSTQIIGVRSVRVAAGRFSALEVRSTLTQPGSRYGSGVRTVWLAPGRGLVKLTFNHRDGSVSQVELIR